MGNLESQMGQQQLGRPVGPQVTACPDGYSAIRSRQPVCVPAQADCGANLVWNAQLGACVLPQGALAPAAAQFAQQYPQAAQDVRQGVAQQYARDQVQQYAQDAAQQYGQQAAQQYGQNMGYGSY
jgi:hypothetical protein